MNIVSRTSLLLLFGFSFLHADEDRLFAALTRTVELKSAEEVAAWKFEKMDFEEWRSAVAEPEWELLTSTQTTDFYFAVFRSGNHLIFWNLDRSAQYRSTSTGTSPNGEGPSKWVALEHQVRHPSGGLKHMARGLVYRMPEAHEGSVEITHTVGGKEKRKQVFQTKIPWPSEAE